MLHHIEAGALGEDLPARVYVRGFIRAYARLLRLPEDQPLRLFDDALCALRRAAEVAAATPVVRVAGKAAPSAEEIEPGARPAIGLAAFVVIVLVIATITLSLFLRQPPQSGEGLSRGNDQTPAGALLLSNSRAV
jgi:cytoskeletal protein RodZ